MKSIYEVEMAGSGVGNKEESPKEKEARVEKEIEKLKEMIHEAKEKVKDLKGKKNKIKEQLKEKAGEALEALDHAMHKKHEVHHDEVEMGKKMHDWFDKNHKQIMKVKEEIEKLKSEKNESHNLISSFSDFMNESKKADYKETMNRLKESYFKDNNFLRSGKIDEEVDEWIKNKLGIDIDEEFEEHYNNSRVLLYEYLFDDHDEPKKDQSVKESYINENRLHLQPKLKTIFDKIISKHGRSFSNDTLSQWEDWSYDQSMPKEVIAAAKKLGAPYDKIEFFNSDENPTAFQAFVNDLDKSDITCEYGTYKNERGQTIYFAVAINQ